MSYIVSEVYDAFRELGLSEAEAAAGTIPGQQHVVTKADIVRDFQMLYRISMPWRGPLGRGCAPQRSR